MAPLAIYQRKPLEITWQSIIGSILISTILSFSYPYIVLKLGIGPSMSILAALLGTVWFRLTASRTRGMNYLGINIAQTMATTGSSIAFMCVVYAAFGYGEMNEKVNISLHVTPLMVFIWLCVNGIIGVFVAGLFRKYFIDDPEMAFPDGVAAATTIQVLDSTDPSSRSQIRTLGIGTLVGVAIAFLREGLGKLPSLWFFPRLLVGIEWAPLTFGTGMLISLNVGLSMLLGTIVVTIFGPWVMQHAGDAIIGQSVAPQYLDEVMRIVHSSVPFKELTDAESNLLIHHGGMASVAFKKGIDYSVLMLWFMWPATIMMITDSLTAVLLKWNKISEMFQTLGRRSGSREELELSLKTVWGGIISLTVLLAIVQSLFFHLPWWMTTLSVLVSFPLILVGVRVLGLTNQGPVSLMANSAQVFFRLLSSHIGHNLVAAGMGGAINAMAEGMIQCFKTGRILKATPRTLSIVSMVGAVIGSLAVAIMYPLLVQQYGLGPDGLTAPTGLKLANMAVLLGEGISALPPGALLWSCLAGLAGILLAVLKDRTKSPWLPNASGFGFALILPGYIIIPIAIGSVVGWLWRRASEAGYELHNAVLASGFIAGETLVAGLVLPIMSLFQK